MVRKCLTYRTGIHIERVIVYHWHYRMTKLPPGFTHELRQHLFDQQPANDERTGVPILDFENFCCGKRTANFIVRAG